MSNPNGTPIWFELTTADPDKSKNFYAHTIGWKVTPSASPEHGGYRIANAPEGAGVAGLMQPPPGMGGASGWMIYFAADDVDAMAQKVKQLGGTLHFGPMDIPHVGRFATVADPQGVMFQLMKGASSEPSQAFRQMAPGEEGGFGHGVWIELATPDPAAALDFYSTLFGWSKQGAMPMGDMGDYTFIGAGDNLRPGAIMPSETTGAEARWGVYFHVPDIDAAIVAAKSMGGTLARGPDQIPGGAYSAKLTDSLGNSVGIVGERR